MFYQGRSMLFYGGGGWGKWVGMSKNVGYHGCPTTKNEKQKQKHWLKRRKAAPQKQNFDQNIKDLKSHIRNSFFENIISGIQRFYIRLHVPVDIIRVVF